MTEVLRKKPNKSVTPRRKHSKRCLFCMNACGCKVAEHYELLVNVGFMDFINDKLICKNHHKQLDKQFKMAKAKEELICGLEYYKDLCYELALKKMIYEAENCTHIKDKELLKKRLQNIYLDYEASVQKREDKEGKLEGKLEGKKL